jgi:hypothetical protein
MMRRGSRRGKRRSIAADCDSARIAREAIVG